MRHQSRARVLGTLTLCAGLSVACSSSSSDGGPGSTGGFQLERISVLPGAVWELNRPIEFEFSEPVDFSTVGSNTILITTSTGKPATGSFAYMLIDADNDGIVETPDESTIVFQPTCPTDGSTLDGGFESGGVIYTIRVVGQSSGSNNVVRAQSGRSLVTSQQRQFSTPQGADPTALYVDGAVGPPSANVRLAGAMITSGASYLEIGGDPDPESRIYFEFDATGPSYGIAPGANAPSAAPLNYYSDSDGQIAFVIEFNQAINPDEENLSDERLGVEYLSGMTWIPVETRIELLSNCTATGASVRLVPVGPLPAGGSVRAVVRGGFEDITRLATQVDEDEFAVTPTQTIAFASLANASDSADEFFESFDFAADSGMSAHDESISDPLPQASWGGGLLTAGYDFDGTGGEDQQFDWVIPAGETFVFDTTETPIVGGPGGVAMYVQNVVGGVVEVRDFTIEPGATLSVTGPNPLQINATRTVRIDGTLDLSGADAPDVFSSGQGNVPEISGPSIAGGGRGGFASQATSASTPVGGTGGGPFGEPNTGGKGGESAYAASGLGKDARRPGGGGGGRFRADFDENVEGLFAGMGEKGNDLFARSPVTGLAPLGGEPGAGPFLDEDASNDFFGVYPVATYDLNGVGTASDYVRGELTGLWAGYGGGGGGDAIPSSVYPPSGWSPDHDEKGGAGGGGGGALRIRALGPIVFGHASGIGRILAEGGSGAIGESTIGLDHVGGTGGSGSGGHIVLESATEVDFTDGDPGFLDPNLPFISVMGAPGRVGPTAELPAEDYSYGGSGGPGLIQIHVPDLLEPGIDPMTTNVVLPAYADGLPANGTTLPTNVDAELNAVTRPFALLMLPNYGPSSKTRSNWIALGGAEVDPDDPMGNPDLVQFLFGGVETAAGPDQGKILATAGVVDEIAPLLGPEAITGNVTVPGPLTLVIAGASLDPLVNDASPISSDMYLRSPGLLRQFTLRTRDGVTPTDLLDFEVVSASYDDMTTALTLTVSEAAGETIQDFLGRTTNATYELIPSFFRVVTGGMVGTLPDDSYVRISFEGTGDDGTGNPDEMMILVPETTDITEFNAQNPGDLQFFRFYVEFNLDDSGDGLTVDTLPASLEFLRVPFRF